MRVMTGFPVKYLVVLGVLALLTACGGGSGGGGRAIPATLTSISITPATATLRISGGRSQALTLLGHYSNNTTQDFTHSTSTTWATSNPGNVALTANVATAGPSCSAPCSATITATYTTTRNVITATATVTIRPDNFTLSASGIDPLVSQQWHLRNTGQNAFADYVGTANNDIKAESVFNSATCAPIIGGGCTGYGVTVAIVDSGLEIAHEDLEANVVRNGSWNFNNNSTDPTNPATDGDHGTSVAGIVASQSYNGKGGIGVAPEASLKGFNLLESTPSEPTFVASLGGSTANPNSSDVAIFNQSFGIPTTEPFSENTTVTQQYASGVSTLRNGKGALYIKAAGNGFTSILGFTASVCGAASALGISCENSNFDVNNTLPYNIVVGAFNANGFKSSYSTTGSALWASAPGGEYGANASVVGNIYVHAVYEPAMVTTDQSSCTSGYATTANGGSTFDTGVNALNISCNYTNAMNGTSSATPVTAGVVALILEANPDLTWRDVKHILASTPTIKPAKAAITTTLNAVSYTAEQGWVTNAAGYSFHNWYGFGVVNAAAAVTMAQGTCASGCGLGAFTAYPSTSTWTSSPALNASIPNNSATGATHTINIASGAPGFIEAVQIQVDISHSYWGDLGIELTSPSGTKSILKNIRDGFTYDSTGLLLKTMTLATNAFYGENSNAGAGWAIRVVDGNNGTSPSTNTSGGTLNSWGIRIYGH